MTDLIHAFCAMADELDSHPEIHVSRRAVAAPASSEDLDAVRRRWAGALDADLLALYRRADGLELAWSLTADPRLRVPNATAGLGFPYGTSGSGVIRVPSLKDGLLAERSGFYNPDLFGPDETVRVGARDIGCERLLSELRMIDAFGGPSACACLLPQSVGGPGVFLVGDDGGTLLDQTPMSFADYFNRALAVRGAADLPRSWAEESRAPAWQRGRLTWRPDRSFLDRLVESLRPDLAWWRDVLAHVA